MQDSRWLAIAVALMVAACGAQSIDPPDAAGTDTLPPAGSSGTSGGAATPTATGEAPDPTSGDASTAGETTAAPATTDASGASESSGTTTGAEVSFGSCIEGVFANGYPGIDFDAEGLTVGSHCAGTDHQSIGGVERVVFLGDSITVGTPPTDTDDYYRNALAARLADDFGLVFGGDQALWETPNPLEGQSFVLHSGDFSSCARWGARNDDLFAGEQFVECYPEAQRGLTTLTIITSGGNDVAAMGRAALDGATMEEIWAMAESAADHKRDTLEWLTDEANFPGGSYVVFADVYDPSDGIGTLENCELSPLVGFEDFELPEPEILEFLQRSYAELAADTSADLVFLHKAFCGHGFSADDPAAPCYRGPGNAEWYDLSCSHPNPTGHGSIADIFYAVISE